MGKKYNELEMLTIQIMKNNIPLKEKNLKENFSYYDFDDDFIVESLIGDSWEFKHPLINELNKHSGNNEVVSEQKLLEDFANENKQLLDNVFDTMRKSKHPMAYDVYQSSNGNPYDKEEFSNNLHMAMQYTASKIIFNMCKENKDMDGFYKTYASFSLKTGAAKSFDEGQYLHFPVGLKSISKVLDKINEIGRETENDWVKKPKNKVLEKEKAKCDKNKSEIDFSK